MASKNIEKATAKPHSSDRRSSGRRARWWTWASVGLLTLGVGALILPSLICATPIADRVASSAAGRYGWQAKFSGIRFGWLTPFHATGIELLGPSGATKIEIGAIKSDVKLIHLLTGTSDYGLVELHDAKLQVAVRPGMTSLEEDLAAFSQADDPGNPSNNPSADLSARVLCENAELTILGPDQKPWTITSVQFTADCQRAAEQWHGTGKLAAVVTDSQNRSGKLQSVFGLVPSVAGSTSQWTADLNVENFPLSFAQLATLRLPELTESLPRQVDGMLNCNLAIRGDLQNQAIQIQAAPVICTQLTFSDPMMLARPWHLNQLRVDGAMQWWQGNLRGDPIKIVTDVGSAELTGVLAIDRLSGAIQEQLTALAGDVDLQLDVAKFDAAFPGMIPLREDARLLTGSARLHAKAENDPEGRPKLTVTTETDHISGSAFQKEVSIPPTSFHMILRPTAGWPTAERLELHSIFANASASGEMQRGNAQFDLDLARLSEFVKPLIDLPELQLDGQASGQLSWALTANQRWSMQGKGNASRLAVRLPGGASLQEPNLDMELMAAGIWQLDHLAELSETRLALNDGGQAWEVLLTQPISQPSATSILPLHAKGQGQLASLRQIAGPWLPLSIGDATGNFRTEIKAALSSSQLELLSATAEIQEASLVYDEHWYRPETVTLDYQGSALFPATSFTVERLKVQSPAVALEARGKWLDQQAPELEASYRVDFRKLGDVMGVNAGSSGSLAVRPASAAGAMTPAPVSNWLHGELVGQAKVTSEGNQCDVRLNADLSNLTILQLSPTEAPLGQILPPTPAPPQILWSERAVHLEGRVLADLAQSIFKTEGLQFKSDWFDTTLKGSSQTSPTLEATLAGDLTIDSAILAQRTEPLIGQRIALNGVHKGPVTFILKSDEEVARWKATCEIGWQSGQLASLELGPAKIELQADEKQINVMPTTIPLRNGNVKLAGQATYDPEPMSINVPPGLIVDNVQLDADLCRGWLKYMAPIVADATSVKGQFSLQLDQATYVPSIPERSLISGQLKISNAEVGPGPLSGVLSSLIETVKAAAKGQTAAPSDPSNRQWIYLPEQTVDFAMKQGLVEHRNMTFQSGNVMISTSGTVALDGRVSLIAKIPLDAKWLGDDAVSRSLIGQTLQLPVDGTLSRPSLDSRTVREMLTQIGTQAVEKAAGNLLNRTLERGLDKLLRPK